MIEKFIFIFCCLLANTWSTPSENFAFIKNGNSYEFTLGADFVETPNPGYIAFTNSLLQDFKAGKIPVEALNNFNESFQTYFHFQKYKKFVDFLLSVNNKTMMPWSDPIDLPDYHGDDMDFQNAKVNGLPRNNAETKYDALNSEDQFKINYTAKSDLVVFTSEFKLSNFTYSLKYHLKMCNFKAYLHGIRGNITGFHFRFSLEYLSDELQHTYNSSLKHYNLVNEFVEKQFLAATSSKYLPFISEKLAPEFANALGESELKYLSSYMESMLSTFVKSAHQYIAAKGLNNFELKPVYFKKSIDKTRKYVQKCKGIKVEGILNYVKFQLINSTDQQLSYLPFIVKLTDTILFTYPENGDKQAFVTFVVHSGGHKNNEKFKIKSIRLTAVYEEKYEIESDGNVSSVDSLNNDIGFLMSLELYNFDPKYELLVNHTADGMARAMNRTLLNKY